MSDAVVTTLITTIGLVIVGLLSFLGVRVTQAVSHSKSAATDSKSAAADSAIAKEQVQNSHKTNLREESDERHKALTDALDTILGKQAEQARSLDDVKASQRGLQRDIGRLADADLEHTKAAREDRARLSQHLEATIAGHAGTKE
ncbi:MULTISPECIES: hypothetical protein [Cryobacterium]|uniref:hypothetical protein n=1 Tax=Cryobacterium TaxID=69578 RepID=UPI000CD3E907|nr:MULTISPECIES: hypothetical protein [Cryobacterium]POH63646.1 hypothetical protein C3B60_16155 [Cryobacterium zongtaii]TFC45565.1 hypothetical protein E3O57_07930 [Cryobacterium sp. TMN-39-2]